MRMVIFDLEMTQPANQIIQIGAVAVDTNHMSIKPIFNRFCHPGDLPGDEITLLTGITRQNVMDACPLSAVLDDFWDVVPKHGKTLAAWGGDWDVLLEACQRYKVGFEWPHRYDIKQFVNLYDHFCSMGNARLKRGLGAAMVAHELEFEGAAHNAFDDAYNTARLFLDVVLKLQAGRFK